MSDDFISTDFMVNAHIRIAEHHGVSIVVRRRGDNTNGTLLLKINLLDGTSNILTQARYEDERVWNPVNPDGPMNDAEAERYLERQAQIDPDSWHLEIEDRQGRHWFPGKIVK